MSRLTVSTVLAVLVAAPVGGLVVVVWAQAEVTARDGDPGDGIGYVIPALLGAAAAALLVLAAAAVVLAATRDSATCARVARWVVAIPVAAVLPFMLLLLTGSAGALLPAVLPVAITGAAAGAVWWSARAGVAVLGVFLVGGVTTVAVLGPDAVFLLLPHLLLSFGSWVVALGLLGRVVLGWDRSASALGIE